MISFSILPFLWDVLWPFGLWSPLSTSVPFFPLRFLLITSKKISESCKKNTTSIGKYCYIGLYSIQIITSGKDVFVSNKSWLTQLTCSRSCCGCFFTMCSVFCASDVTSILQKSHFIFRGILFFNTFFSACFLLISSMNSKATVSDARTVYVLIDRPGNVLFFVTGMQFTRSKHIYYEQ